MSNAENLKRYVCSSKPFSPVVSRIFHLLVFFVSTVTAYLTALESLRTQWYTVSKTEPLVQWIGSSIYLGVFVIVILHMVRVYISIEELDNPHSSLRRNHVDPLPNEIKVWEQIVRLGLFCALTLFVTMRFASSGSAIRDAFLFLTGLYLLMVVWDMLVGISHFRNRTDRSRHFLASLWDAFWTHTFFVSSILGFLLSILVVVVAPDDGDKKASGRWILIAILLCIYAASIVLSFFSSSSKDLGLRSFLQHVLDDFLSIFLAPDFGVKCNPRRQLVVGPERQPVLSPILCADTNNDCAKREELSTEWIVECARANDQDIAGRVS